MNIHELLSTRERVEILEFILNKRGQITVSGVAHGLGVSKGLVSKFFNILRKERILRKKKESILSNRPHQYESSKNLIELEQIRSKNLPKI